MEGMPSALPDGEPVPDDGSLPAHALAGAAERPLGFYLHVPYCATRCGYCDFNTYTATELRGTGGVLASRDNYAETLIDEVRLARKVLGDDPRPVRTVFVGGGTPTLLAADDLVRMLGRSATSSASPTTRRSRRRRTRSRWTRRTSRPCGPAASTVSPSACRAPGSTY
uniref:Radical SAM core domain-containing protein n=1 Tax=Streptomyces avermitilis TaxID=33903 RepID=A0A499VH22_STRAX|nr:hypothetical protein SAVMC3_63620 [Streptomyces avermitilis]